MDFMTLAGLGQDDYIALLKANGYEVLSTQHWELEGCNRIVIGKDGQTFTFRLKKFNFYSEVVYRIQNLNLSIIPEHLKDDIQACMSAYAQHQQLRALKRVTHDQRYKADSDKKTKEE